MLWLWRLRMDNHHRGGDARDGEEDLQERAELNARVGAGAEDEVGVVEQRVVEQQRGDGRDEGEAHHTAAMRAVRRVEGSSAPPFERCGEDVDIPAPLCLEGADR